MTQKQLLDRYINHEIDENKLERNFSFMGRFGKVGIYTFSFNTDDYSIDTEVCISEEKIIGLNSEKELRDDGWGINPDAGPEEIQPEEYDTMSCYLDCVMRA